MKIKESTNKESQQIYDLIVKNKSIMPITFSFLETYTKSKKNKDLLLINSRKHQTDMYLPRPFYKKIF